MQNIMFLLPTLNKVVGIYLSSSVFYPFHPISHGYFFMFLMLYTQALFLLGIMEKNFLFYPNPQSKSMLQTCIITMRPKHTNTKVRPQQATHLITSSDSYLSKHDGHEFLYAFSPEHQVMNACVLPIHMLHALLL